MSGTVVVVGSINVDLVSKVDRLPRAGETVMGGTFVQTHGGKGANQAVAAGRAGARVELIGMLGADDFGRAARAELDAQGVSTAHVGTASAHTGVAQILVDDAGENLIAVASGANLELDGDTVTRAVDQLDVDDAVMLSVLEVPDDAVLAAARAARERGWPFVLNPAPARPLTTDLLGLCSVLTPNEHEAVELGVASASDLIEAGVEAVVVTQGAAGARLLRRGQADVHVDAFDARVVDTTGAGDAFSGVLAAALAAGTELDAAVHRGAAAGALATEEVGARAALPGRDAIEDLVGRRTGP